MTEERLKKIVKLSEEQYNTLKSTGTVTIEGNILTYSPTNTIYVTPKTVQVPTVKSFTGVAISSIFTQVEPIKIRSIKLKFTADTNFQGCSYDLKTSAAGQAVTNYNEESAPLIATTNEYLHLVKTYSYESNYEFNCGNYKLEWSGSGIPKLSYYGIQYTSASSGAHWIEASTTTDFVVDAVVEIDQ